MRRFLAVLLPALLMLNISLSEENVNAITLLEQRDRYITCETETKIKTKRGISTTTGEKSKEQYNPVLVELNNENGGVYVTAPIGILDADFIYEYQVRTDGTMGMSALFQDTVPNKVGPIGNATVGGLMVQQDWNCGYVYHGIPSAEDGTVSELGYSIENWIGTNGLEQGDVLFPADVSSVKPWKKYFSEDTSMIVEENHFINASGIRSILTSAKHEAKPASLQFLKDLEAEVSEIPVREIDIRTASRTFSSGFIYDDETHTYGRWVGANNQYGDTKRNEQLTVSNLIIQRVDYITSNKNMAPVTTGRGNADIFMLGCYIEGYWVRDKAEDKTTYYDSEGNLLQLVPGTTFVSLLSNSVPVVILNY